MTERQATLEEITLYRADEARACSFLCGRETAVHTARGVFVCIDCLSRLCVHDLATSPAEAEATVTKEPNEEVALDPWKHRSAAMRCSTCMYFVPKQPHGPRPPDSKDVGRCRRHAPTMSGYPVVFRTDWCGDHKLDEEKT